MGAGWGAGFPSPFALGGSRGTWSLSLSLSLASDFSFYVVFY